MDEALASRAYDNTALPIGHNQTISQPYIVARMTEALLDGRKPDRILEIGTGCGYQTAILAQLARRVYSIERIEALLAGTRERFHSLNYRNINAKYGDGNKGWPEQRAIPGNPGIGRARNSPRGAHGTTGFRGQNGHSNRPQRGSEIALHHTHPGRSGGKIS